MPLTAMAKKCGTMLCNQRCKTRVYIAGGVIYEAMNDRMHFCPIAQRAKEFEGYYNMIQIKAVRKKVEAISEKLSALTNITMELAQSVDEITALLDWREEQNKPLAEAFVKRKQKGNTITSTPATTGPVIRLASEMLTK